MNRNTYIYLLLTIVEGFCLAPVPCADALRSVHFVAACPGYACRCSVARVRPRLGVCRSILGHTELLSLQCRMQCVQHNTVSLRCCELLP